VPIPVGINKGTVKCEMDNDGHLYIFAVSEKAEARKIPIDVKQPGPMRQIKVEVEMHH
jgi:hypothetical protein